MLGDHPADGSNQPDSFWLLPQQFNSLAKRMQHIAVERAAGECHAACDRQLLLQRKTELVCLHLRSHRKARIEVNKIRLRRADAAKLGDAPPDVAETRAGVRVGPLNHWHRMI